MGIEYRIECDDILRVDLGRRLQCFDPKPDVTENTASFHLPENESEMPDVYVEWDGETVYLVEYGDSKLASRLLGEIVRACATLNDHVMVQEL